MKKPFTYKLMMLSFIFFFIASIPGISQTLIISEVVDGPGTGGYPKYVEITNTGMVAVDLTGLKIRKSSNGGAFGDAYTFAAFNLPSGESVVVTNMDNATSGQLWTDYNLTAPTNVVHGVTNVNGNGDDAYALTDGLDNIIDIYGAEVDGTGSAWDYLDSYAYRNSSVVAPSTTFQASEWTVAPTNTLDGQAADLSGFLTPGTHTYTPPSSNDNTSSANIDGVTQPAAATLSSITDDILEAVPVFRFNLTDSASGDGLPTKVTSFTFKAGPDNTANWAEDVGGAYFMTGTTTPQLLVTGEMVVSEGTVTVPLTTPLEIADGADTLVHLFIFPDSTTTDNAVVQVMIDADAHGFMADPTGSVFSPAFVADIVGNAFTIEVVATDLWFLPQVSDVIGPYQSVYVGATDENGNIDSDNAGTDVTLTYSGTGTLSGTNPVATDAGIAAFSDLSYDTEEVGVTLTAAGGSLASVVSDPFDISFIALPYLEDFTDGFGYVSTFSVSGDTKEWVNDLGTVAQMNGYNSGDLEEDWLILPAIDFTGFDNLAMTFETWYRFGNDDADNYLKLMYSTDYTSGSPADATWTELSFNKPGNQQEWASSGVIDISALSGFVTIAFKYHYNVDNYRRWEIDNILIEEATSPMIQNVTYTPEFPEATEPVSVAADITDDLSIDTAYLVWYPNGALASEWDTIAMDVTSGDNYTTVTDIPAQDVDTVYTHIVSFDGDSQVKKYSDFYLILPTPSIYDIQYSMDDPANSLFEGMIVRTTGIVTANDTVGRYKDDGFFIQDSASTWNGIYVHDFNENALKRGDSIVIVAEVEEYFNLTELKNIISIDVIAIDKTLPEPLVITPGEFGEPYEGVLVQLQDVKVKATRDKVGNGQFVVTDGTDTVLIDDAMIRPDVVKDSVYTITGIGFYSYGELKLLPRDMSDIEGYIKVNMAPVIGTVSISPESPTDTDIVTLSFTITDDAEAPIHIDSVSLMYGTTEGVYDMEASVTADGFDATVFFADIPAMSAGTMVYYEISATDSDAENPLTSIITGSYEVVTGVGTSFSTLSNVSLFPNPNDGAFTLTFNSTSAATLNMSVLDMQGRVIEAGVLNIQGNRSQHNIVLEKAERGLYIIRLENDGNTLYKRLLIE